MRTIDKIMQEWRDAGCPMPPQPVNGKYELEIEVAATKWNRLHNEKKTAPYWCIKEVRPTDCKDGHSYSTIIQPDRLQRSLVYTHWMDKKIPKKIKDVLNTGKYFVIKVSVSNPIQMRELLVEEVIDIKRK